MKAILQPIHPEHCANILSGRKTIELRKRIPKIELPYKVYTYCTKPNTTNPKEYLEIPCSGRIYKGNGKVVGEYICRDISEYEFITNPWIVYYNSYKISKLDLMRLSLSLADIHNYGKGKTLYGMHISDLVIYDRPKELSEFYRLLCEKNSCENCFINEECNKYGTVCYYRQEITRPPQSWCYVEEVKQ